MATCGEMIDHLANNGKAKAKVWDEGQWITAGKFKFIDELGDVYPIRPTHLTEQWVLL